MGTSPFDFLNAITEKTDDSQLDIGDYNAFMVNRGLSYFPDTVLWAQEMNMRHLMPGKFQYAFLRRIVDKRRRRSKWHKKELEDAELLTLVRRRYHVDEQGAFELLELMTDEQKELIRKTGDKGGRK